jgi:hypothetical protein
MQHVLNHEVAHTFVNTEFERQDANAHSSEPSVFYDILLMQLLATRVPRW